MKKEITTSILRGSKLSRTELINSVLDFGFDSDEAEVVADEIVTEVNHRLPGTLYWMPEFSEVWADTEDETKISIEEFSDILNEAFGEIAYNK